MHLAKGGGWEEVSKVGGGRGMMSLYEYQRSFGCTVVLEFSNPMGVQVGWVMMYSWTISSVSLKPRMRYCMQESV